MNTRRSIFFRSCSRIFAIVRSMLSEIFDESAYARFLERRHLATSSRAYTEFLQENEKTRARRPRCC